MKKVFRFILDIVLIFVICEGIFSLVDIFKAASWLPAYKLILASVLVVFSFLSSGLGIYAHYRDKEEEKQWIEINLNFRRGDVVDRFFADHNIDSSNQRDFAERAVTKEIYRIIREEEKKFSNS